MNGRDNRGRRRPFRKDGRSGAPAKQERGQNSSGAHEGRADSRYASPGTDKAEPPFRTRKRGDRGYGGSKFRPEKSNWIPPKQSSEPMPELSCVRCGEPINDTSEALRDRNSGEPVHFSCVLSELSEQEKLEAGDTLSYIGGGRFGIVHLSEGKGDPKKFTIKKIIEWEDKDKRAEWRGAIADHYSIT